LWRGRAEAEMARRAAKAAKRAMVKSISEVLKIK
jgi:hypothetical protein